MRALAGCHKMSSPIPVRSHVGRGRARKHSTLAAIVLKWSSARRRYERQGLLVEADALEQAEEECLADSEARDRRRERAAERRAELDQEFVSRFAEHIRGLFPSCPLGRELVIAEHACLKYSGRVGRSVAAKNLASLISLWALTAYLTNSGVASENAS